MLALRDVYWRALAFPVILGSNPTIDSIAGGKDAAGDACHLKHLIQSHNCRTLKEPIAHLSAQPTQTRICMQEPHFRPLILRRWLMGRQWHEVIGHWVAYIALHI